MIVYEIEPTHSDYLLQEDIDLNLRFTNQDSAAAEIPDPTNARNSQPVFAVIGPPYPQGVMFSNWSIENAGEPAPPVTSITLAAGAAWEGQYPLSGMIDLVSPGEYRVASLVALQSGNVRAADRKFRVNRPDPVSLHIGQGVRPFDAAQGQIVFLQRESKALGVYSIRFDETDPSNREIQLQPVLRRATAGANATDILSPWHNTPFFDEMLQWIVWREGRTLKVLNDAETTALSFDLPLDPAYLVRPPLKTTGGPVEVMAVSADRRKLVMVSVSPQLPAKASVAWQVDLPAEPASIAAALGPKDGANVRHIAFSVAHPKGVDVYHATFTNGAAPSVFAMATIGGAHLQAKVPLALTVTQDGVAHAIIAVEGALVEIPFDETPGRPVRTQLPHLDREPEDGAILYVERAGSAIEREFVVSAGSETWALTRSGPMKMTPRSYTKPLAVIAGKDVSYLLYCEKDRGFHFQPVPR